MARHSTEQSAWLTLIPLSLCTRTGNAAPVRDGDGRFPRREWLPRESAADREHAHVGVEREVPGGPEDHERAGGRTSVSFPSLYTSVLRNRA